MRRNGEDEEVPVSELVPGDILKLESGDIVPADAVIRHAQGLQVDETAFTGESVPVSKAAAESSETLENNKLLQGTVIVRGLAYAEVTATGSHTSCAHSTHRLKYRKCERTYQRGR